ncbi:MAG: hypothetical protein GY820_27080 [Gammaproteobacteria bacterium]|nr:hypothetical protein [Gammaproteobacteria bacterium]
MLNIKPWKLAVFWLASIIVTYFSASQAIYFSWQSAFQNRMHEIEYLEKMFYTYSAVSIIFLVVDVMLVVLFIKAINRKSREKLHNK